MNGIVCCINWGFSDEEQGKTTTSESESESEHRTAALVE